MSGLEKLSMGHVSWEDLRKQALHCPILAAMFERGRRGDFLSTEEGLLWATLMLSELRIKALEEHAQTLARVPFTFMTPP